MNIFKKIKKWYQYNFWWMKDMEIVKTKTGARCVECHAGNMFKSDGVKYILCGEHRKCPCKMDECLKLKKPKGNPDFIPLESIGIKEEDDMKKARSWGKSKFMCPICNSRSVSLSSDGKKYYFKCNHCGYKK